MAPTPEQEAVLLDEPRAALLQATGVPGPVRDPRLSPAGNRLARQLGMLLDLLGRLENWQRHPGLAELKRDDRRLLAPQFARLARDARGVADLVDDLWPLESPDEAVMNEEMRNEIVRRRQAGPRCGASPATWAWRATRCRASFAAGKPTAPARRPPAPAAGGPAWSIPSTTRSGSCWSAIRTSPSVRVFEELRLRGFTGGLHHRPRARARTAAAADA